MSFPEKKMTECANYVGPPDALLRTTVMMRNLPNKYTQDSLIALINEQGFEKKFDFFYLPIDFRNKVNIGYAFVNFTTSEDAVTFMRKFDGYNNWPYNSRKVCKVSWS